MADKNMHILRYSFDHSSHETLSAGNTGVYLDAKQTSMTSKDFLTSLCLVSLCVGLCEYI